MRLPVFVLLLLSLPACLLGLRAEEKSTLRPWNNYRTMLWMSGAMDKHKDKQALIFERLRELGINTAMTGRDGDPWPFIDAGFGYYVENIINRGLCLKYSSSVTNWSAFIDEWMKNRDERALARDYCLDDPGWRESVLDVMRKAARHHAPFAPVAYDLRDEMSVTISANPFDYDFSPQALAGFRDWLKTQYATLEKLNAQWETDFPSWDAVRPFTTDQIKARMVTGERMPKGPPDWSALKQVKFDPLEARKNPTRWNFSPWCDHRTYMDISLARTLDDMRSEARKHDPHTPVGIEGAQMPHAFGGYDLWRLAQAVDWMEPYDVCNTREILGSFMPGKPLLSTVFEKETLAAQRRLWHLLLLGDRGCIVWWSEDVIDWGRPDLPLTEKGRALAPVLRQMTSPLARLFMLAEREFDPIGIHYSQPSIQVAWLLESTVDGKTWPRRFSSFETTHNRHAMVRNGMLKAFQDLGFRPQFVSDVELAGGAALKRGIRVLGLPQSILGKAAATKIEDDMLNDDRDDPPSLLFVSEGPWSLFDEHGRLSADSAWLDVSGGDPATPFPNRSMVIVMNESDKPSGDDLKQPFSSYSSQRLTADGGADFLADLVAKLQRQAIEPPIHVPPSARVLVHRYKIGPHRLLAFERNIEWKMSENLKQAGGNAELEKPVTFTAEWDEPAEVVDLWSGKRLGSTNQIEVNLDPWKPSLYALLDAPMVGDVVTELLKETLQ